MVVNLLSHTRHDLDVVRRMHRHHLCVYSDPILVVRVQSWWDLDKRKHRLVIGVEIVSKSIWPRVGIQTIS